MRAGVDIGGTFTDLVLSEGGRLSIHKLLSTPTQPERAMLAGLAELVPGGIATLQQVAHGSTVATNAILERKGARAALLTTAGFRDLLFIGRQDRPDLYALHPRIPPPLIPRERCYEVPERLDFRGETLLDLDEAAVDHVLDAVAAQGCDAIAVCFLFSYVNDAHEQRVKQRILARGIVQQGWQVVLSSEVLPEFREYERASTVALEAYVRPVMSRYISLLESRLPPKLPLRVMKSDGGVMRAGRVRQQAIHTALSGPAAGVIGAWHLARAAGWEKIITLDMGGTSTDVALVDEQPVPRPESSIDGLPLRLRMLDIETIGAGGGSIGRVDAGGALRVGPESAGADPGPAVYGRGGTLPTLSDANALLGRLDAEYMLGGALALDLPAGKRALAGLAGQINFSPLETAKGIVDIATVHIDRAIRRVSVARGHDPRDFTLVAFGGAGPLHACEAATRLDIPRVLVPPTPGVLCALGLLLADVAVEFSRSVMQEATDETLASLLDIQDALLGQARAELEREGIAAGDRVFVVSLDMRYQGQAYELSIPYSAAAADDFHAAHERTYGHAMRWRTVEIVSLRVAGRGISEKPEFARQAAQQHIPAPLGQKSSPLGGTINLYKRELLLPGAEFTGEALVFQLDSTIYVPADWAARVDSLGNLLLSRD
ncbi:MAG: hydantoinase/oxoprolinase family protein [Chloroflexi bacterium]|nr:hydantoinase/oxoprolinase family protein [Chloroflexota bacterium]MCY3583228.1 hydantoinase/oxoprolinase family protein [Chloroflexota bacterium]MCY3717328.1 hydantoinase/oxoprolinase family protein [Chloroflexota bacterium]MDE2651282.1 hydantoinase/oxoprolinase family protein [Chloroflexota bacterium]MXV92799.1 hydantoinase/oxoprolinase family protein [Chloroflexota bacterium]